MNKDFVEYEEALELKQLGFDEPCFGVYATKDGYVRKSAYDENGDAPTYSQAFRFFRDKHNINAQIAFCEYSVSSENSWKFTFDNPTNVLIWNGKFNTYEEAELECLKVLIEMVKTK